MSIFRNWWFMLGMATFLGDLFFIMLKLTFKKKPRCYNKPETCAVRSESNSKKVLTGSDNI